MEKTDKRLFQIYFAGASLAFGVPLILGEIVGLIWGASLLDSPQVYSASYLLAHLLGGILGGALVVKNLPGRDIVKSGSITGLLAYLLHQAIYFMFYGTGVLGDLNTLMALVGGSVAGAFAYGRLGK